MGHATKKEDGQARMLTARSGTVLLIAIVVLALDQISKFAALALLKEYVPLDVAAMIALRLGYNTGISFGMFASETAANRLVLIAVTALVTVVMLIYALRSRDTLERAGLAAIVGGAAGNLTDRIYRGRVTDFIDFHIAQWHWPAFNLADTAICLGVMALLWAALRGQVGQERKKVYERDT